MYLPVVKGFLLGSFPVYPALTLPMLMGLPSEVASSEVETP